VFLAAETAPGLGTGMELKLGYKQTDVGFYTLMLFPLPVFTALSVTSALGRVSASSGTIFGTWLI
jgi:hypothetical protein